MQAPPAHKTHLHHKHPGTVPSEKNPSKTIKSSKELQETSGSPWAPEHFLNTLQGQRAQNHWYQKADTKSQGQTFRHYVVSMSRNYTATGCCIVLFHQGSSVKAFWREALILTDSKGKNLYEHKPPCTDCLKAFHCHTSALLPKQWYKTDQQFSKQQEEMGEQLHIHLAQK